MKSLIDSSSPTLGFSTALKEVAFPKPTTGTIRMTVSRHPMVGEAGLGLEWGEMKRKQSRELKRQFCEICCSASLQKEAFVSSSPFLIQHIHFSSATSAAEHTTFQCPVCNPLFKELCIIQHCGYLLAPITTAHASRTKQEIILRVKGKKRLFILNMENELCVLYCIEG